jgi:ubiquinone/menaquinone biosynthesis C-methylase UbiE
MGALYDRFMAKTEVVSLRGWRRTLFEDVSGHVLEIGAGTGANLPFYGKAVERVRLFEPDPHMRRHLESRLDDDDDRFEVHGDEIPGEAESFDVVVSTLVLCTVPDPEATLAELMRVLRPGGTFVFLEHVHAEDESTQKWQRRIEPFWKIIGDGCHLTRDTERTIASAGFRIEQIERAPMKPAPFFVRPTIRGRAIKPTAT